MNKETIGLDYEREYEKTKEQMRYELEKQENDLRRFYENKIEDMSLDLIKYEKELKFYKDIIKSVLHINN